MEKNQALNNIWHFNYVIQNNMLRYNKDIHLPKETLDHLFDIKYPMWLQMTIHPTVHKIHKALLP